MSQIIHEPLPWFLNGDINIICFSEEI